MAAQLVYDGTCGLCTRSVAFVQRRDRHGRIDPMPSDAPDGRRALEAAGALGAESQTLVLVWRGRAWLRSAGVVRLLWLVGGPWRAVAVLLWMVPSPLRNLGYRIVSRNRRRFGHVCPVPQGTTARTAHGPTPDSASRRPRRSDQRSAAPSGKRPAARQGKRSDKRAQGRRRKR